MKKITQVHLIIAVNETKATSKEDVNLFHQGKLEFNSEIKCSLIMPVLWTYGCVRVQDKQLYGYL